MTGTKILAKEELMLLLYGVAGPRSLNSGEDDVPRAGPRWLSEGTEEMAAHLVIADARLTNMPSVRANWVQRAKSSSVTLERLAVLRGQFEAGSNAWAIMPLAVERLVGEGGASKAVSYFERIGRGEPWEAAFASAFGKTPRSVLRRVRGVPPRPLIERAARPQSTRWRSTISVFSETPRPGDQATLTRDYR